MKGWQKDRRAFSESELDLGLQMKLMGQEQRLGLQRQGSAANKNVNGGQDTVRLEVPDELPVELQRAVKPIQVLPHW